MVLCVFQIFCRPVTERVTFYYKLWIELLKHHESVGNANGAFEQTTAGFDGFRWMVVDEAGEGGFELAARISSLLSA